MISERLTYKKFTHDDFIHYTRWYTSDDVMKYIMGRGLTQQEASYRFAKAIAVNEANPELGLYAVFKKEDGIFVGITKLVYTGSHEAEVGYGSLPEFCGKRYATEMLAAAIEYSKTISSIHQLIALVNSANVASKKVLIHRSFELYHTDTELDRPVEYYRLKLEP